MNKYLVIKFTLVAVIFPSLLIFSQNSVSDAKLRGLLKGFGATVVVDNFSELQHMLPDSYNPVISLDKDSSFNIAIPVTEPTYFRLGRNKLYLSPGDNMEVVIDLAKPDHAVFRGNGWEANNYLRQTLFPKAGSYLEAGRNLKATPSETLQYILEKANERENELAQLKGVSDEFKRLESARIKADILMSISMTPIYVKFKNQKDTTDFQKTYIDEFLSISNPIKDSLLQHFTDTSFLQVEVYREICNSLILDETVNPKTLQVFRDYENGFSLAFDKIKPLNDKALLPSYALSVDSIQTKKYRDVLKLLIAEKMKFGNGDTAIDLIMRKTDGTSTSLSSLKGKLIYIDIWATWCGPCMAEMPSLELLKKKYEGNQDIAIVSLSIDDTDSIWLKNLKSRLPGGIQWRIDRANLSDYQVQTIPRYILIDQQFKVIDFNAGMPSEKALHEKLDMLLKN
jgi:thiol-disulfide isomerase/thioredoxin